MKYKWRLLYKPPIEEMTDDPDTWRKVFYISVYDCPSKLDLAVKITELKKLYNMKDKYVYLEDLDTETFVKYAYSKEAYKHFDKV